MCGGDWVMGDVVCNTLASFLWKVPLQKDLRLIIQS